MQNNYTVFEKLNTQILAVAQEERDPLTMKRVEAFVENRFPIVTDHKQVTVELIKRYGVYLVDQKGIIRTWFPGSIAARPRVDLLVKETARLEKVAPPKIVIKDGKVDIQKQGKAALKRDASGKAQAITIRRLWSHNHIRPGDDFKLAFCPIIADGFHVYGSQEKKMTPFKVEFTFPEGIELKSEITYPRAKPVDDKALKMKLAVYEEAIPISTLELKAAETLAPGEIIVRAKITYQACDNEICLPPTELMETFTLKVVPKDQKRQQVYGWKTW